MQTHVIHLALAMVLAACASSPTPRSDAVPQVRQHQDDSHSRPDAEPAKPKASKGKKLGFNVPDGWTPASEVSGPGNVFAIFLHEAAPIGLIAADVRVSDKQALTDTMRGWQKDIEDAKIVTELQVSKDGMRGSFSWTSTVDGTGNSGHGEFVRFPEFPGKTFAFLGFWDTAAHERHKPAVIEMAASTSVSDAE